MVQGPQPRRQTPACARRNFTKLSCPHLSRFSKTQSGEVSGQGQHRRYKSRLGGVGVGLTMGWGERKCASQSGDAGMAGGQRTLPTGFLGGGTQAGALPQGILVVGGTFTARRLNQSILKEINPEHSLEGLMLKLKLQYFGHLMRKVDSLEKTLMLGGIEGRRRRGRQRIR